jgi:hypothetical protein
MKLLMNNDDESNQLDKQVSNQSIHSRIWNQQNLLSHKDIFRIFEISGCNPSLDYNPKATVPFTVVCPTTYRAFLDF